MHGQYGVDYLTGQAYALTTLFIVMLFVLPLHALALQDGIFGCNQTGSYAMSVGSLRAVGGTFVPVSDNAVTLNSGYLVYKECVLRPVVDAESQTVDTAEIQRVLTKFNTGNNGNPYFLQYFGQDQKSVEDNAFNATLYTVTGNLNPAFQSDVQTALARNYAMTSNAPSISLACPYSGNLAAVLNGSSNDLWGGLSAMLDPTCSPYSSYLLAQNQLNGNVAAAQYAWVTQLNWNRGAYSVTDSTGKVLTPGFLVAALAEQAVTSGLRRVENANDIGQMVGRLFADMGNQILGAASGGVAGLSNSIGNQPPYLTQVSHEALQNLGQQVTNVALAVLGPALTVEQAYQAAENSIANVFLQSTNQLRASENTCWNLIITGQQDPANPTGSPLPHVCTSPLSASNTCTGTGGSTLHIATSTAFSQPVIDAQIQPPSLVVIQNVQNSNQALQTIQGLAAGVQNSTDPTAQQAAIQQLDQLVAQGLLHNQSDVDKANQDLSTVQSAMQTLVTNTRNTWTGATGQYDNSGNPTYAAWGGAYTVSGESSADSLGWCNVNQSATLQAWASIWSH